MVPRDVSMHPPHSTGRAVSPHPALGRVSHYRMHSRPQVNPPKPEDAQFAEDNLGREAPRPARRSLRRRRSQCRTRSATY
jgi:hypothetical protein